MSAPNSLSSARVPSTGMFVAVGGMADAVGTQTETVGATETFAGGGMAGGVAGYVAVAQNINGELPHAGATTFGVAGGGDIATAQTGTISINFSHGPTPVAVMTSLTFASAYGAEPLLAHLTTHDAFSAVGSTAFPGIG